MVAQAYLDLPAALSLGCFVSYENLLALLLTSSILLVD